jgi:sugar lactone lactonase YvrE
MLRVSYDGKLMFLADASYIKVTRVSDGARVKPIGRHRLDNPQGICVSPDGELLYVADTNKNHVEVFRISDGKHKRTIAIDDSPYRLCISPNGHFLFVSTEHCITVLNIKDGSLEYIGEPGFGNGQFSSPEGICLSQDGNELYVADGRNNRIQVIRVTDGSHIRTIGERGRGGDPGQFAWPRDVCFSHDGSQLYVADFVNGRIQVFQV